MLKSIKGSKNNMTAEMLHPLKVKDATPTLGEESRAGTERDPGLCFFFGEFLSIKFSSLNLRILSGWWFGAFFVFPYMGNNME